jgi:hypothetical protein
MALYGLENSELFWEKALDTKLLMSWSRHVVVIAFRGTASMANALADLQASLLKTLKKSVRRSNAPNVCNVQQFVSKGCDQIF